MCPHACKQMSHKVLHASCKQARCFRFVCLLFSLCVPTPWEKNRTLELSGGWEPRETRREGGASPAGGGARSRAGDCAAPCLELHSKYFCILVTVVPPWQACWPGPGRNWLPRLLGTLSAGPQLAGTRRRCLPGTGRRAAGNFAAEAVSWWQAQHFLRVISAVAASRHVAGAWQHSSWSLAGSSARACSNSTHAWLLAMSACVTGVRES
jgi:hypothetical protein